MNCLAFTSVRPDVAFPWFEEQSTTASEKILCKVYNDGGHYVASVLLPPKKQRYKRREDDLAALFDELYLTCIKNGFKEKEINSFLFDNLSELSNMPKVLLKQYIIDKIESKKQNLYARKKRFRRKAMLNPWNYFVTFTYSDNLHDEESFKKSLRKCLSNLHSRRGWRYMGVFERAPETGRLHFHGLFYIPDGEMLGGMYERRDYSTREHKMITTHPNTFFEGRFGRNDFSPIDKRELRSGNTLSYILKYIEKTDERIIYSRGIPTDFIMDINKDDIAAEMTDFVLKMVLFDDVVDYERDVLHLCDEDNERVSFVYHIPLPS